jgi:hypothetical protein
MIDSPFNIFQPQQKLALGTWSFESVLRRKVEGKLRLAKGNVQNTGRHTSSKLKLAVDGSPASPDIFEDKEQCDD